MKKAYRFRAPKGRNIEVMFAHTPGKWVSTGTKDMVEAVRLAERQVNSDLREKQPITLRDFAKGFFTAADPQGWRARQEARNRNYAPSFYAGNQSRLDRYILPSFGDRLVGGDI